MALHCLATAAGEVALWAEDSELPPRRASRTARAHPFAVPSDVLTDAVERLAAACGEIHAKDEPRRAGSTLDLIA